MTWTKILTKAEKQHLRENVTMLIGLYNKQAVISELRKCTCVKCQNILTKLESIQ